MLEYLLQLLEEFYNFVVYKTSKFENIDEILDQKTIFYIKSETKDKPYFNEKIFWDLVEKGDALESDRQILKHHSGRILQGITDIMKNPRQRPNVELYIELKSYLKAWRLSDEYINYLMKHYFKNRL